MPLNYQGPWDPSTNTPALVNPPLVATKGDYYRVSAVGTRFSIDFAIGDLICNHTGTSWDKIDNTDAVQTVFGRTGQIVSANGDYAASQVAFSPTGALASTTVQSAIAETAAFTVSPVPIGTIASAPMGSGTWLQMNGQVVSKATYATLFAILGHLPEFNWKYSSTGAVNNRGVAYGAGIYVACHSSGTNSSTDLITWTARTGVSGPAAVTFGNGVFVAVGSSGAISSSSDGIAWTSRTSGVSGNFTNVIYKNSLFIAVGSAGWITSSPDGVTWTAVQTHASANFDYVNYTNGLWIASSNNPSGAPGSGFAYSTNGTVWTHAGSSPYSWAIDATYHYRSDIGGSAGRLIERSADGTTWTSVTTLPEQAAPVLVSLPGGVIMSYAPNLSYTTDGFNTVRKVSWLDIPPAPVAATGTWLVNGLGAAQPFTLRIDAFGVFATVDGSRWTMCHSNTLLNGSTSPKNYFKYYWNGKYFLCYPSITNGGFFYADDPYDPATQFQIPTRTPNGTALYIKALNT